MSNKRKSHGVTSSKMAKKIKTIGSLLDELDRPLYEGKWQEIQQTLKKARKKLTIPEAFSCFLQGLEQVENHLLKQGAADLKAAEAKMKEALDLCQPGHDAALQQLVKIKYGQLLWLRRDYEQCLIALQEGVQCSTPDTTLLHTCKVLAEGNLYLGLSLEQSARAGGSGESDRLAEAISAYEEALRHSLTLLHHAKAAVVSIPRHPAALKAIQVALERGPVLSMHLDMPVRATNIFRRVLQSKDEDVLQEARMICATSLASLLLFHMSPKSYVPPIVTSASSVSAPTQLQEESILVASLAKSVVDTWTVSKTVPSPAVVFDLLTLALSDINLRGQVVQVLEDGMRFACAMPHIWLQFALALVANGQNAQALAVFHECVKLSPDDPLVLAAAANFAVEKVCEPELCIQWATKAADVAKDHFLEPRVHFILGRGYNLRADRELSSQKRGELHKQSLCHLRQAAEMDPRNVDYAFYLALQFAESRKLGEANSEVQRALRLNAGHTSCLHLLALILSAHKKYLEALKVCDLALQKQPENFGLLECKAKLEVIAVSTHQALKTCKHALHLWQKLFSEETSGLIGLVTQDQQSLSDIPLLSYERSANHVPLSTDVASDAGSSHFSLSAAHHTPSNQPNLLQARIWCTIAEVFLSGGKTSDAVSCVHEAQYLAPHLTSVLITHGRVLEVEGNAKQALEQYRNALTLQPGHPTALTLIGQVLHQSGKHSEAEKYLREATSIDQLNHEAWYWLGEVLSAQNQSEKGADCFKTSLDLEPSAPVQPFSAVLSSFVPPC